MLKLKINVRNSPPGYAGKTSHSWYCKLCKFMIYPDLNKEYTIDTAMSHMRIHHNVTADITIELKEYPHGR